MKDGIDQLVETIIGILFRYRLETQVCKCEQQKEDDTINKMGIWS